MKNTFRDGKTIVDNYRQALEKLHYEFLREVIVAVETNVFRILAEVKKVNENVKGIGEHHILKHILEAGVIPYLQTLT